MRQQLRPGQNRLTQEQSDHVRRRSFQGFVISRYYNDVPTIPGIVPFNSGSAPAESKVLDRYRA
jgi:hypothetical protein